MLPAVPTAQVLPAVRPKDLADAAEILVDGGVAALPFNGMYALFGDLEQPHAHKRIMAAKGRVSDKRLAQVTRPEDAAELVDFSRSPWRQRDVLALWRELHGLGIVLPANQHALELQRAAQPTDGTILLVWTEYQPMRTVLEHFRGLGGTALFGTSANKSGLPTSTTTREVWRDFFTEVDVIVADDFTYLPAQRRQSMTLVDLTGTRPRLQRLGSVRISELQAALSAHGFGALHIGPSHMPSSAA
jgi:tRNA A37 threonylcarbamoyladenosine synthetase subunit TsaC/SUA5/YrdC